MICMMLDVPFRTNIKLTESMLNEAIDIENQTTATKKLYLTEKQVGRLITDMGLREAAQQLNATVINSTKEDEPKNV